MHQTCTGTKKTKVSNFKVHQTCTGTKKTKKALQSTWEEATIPLKFFFFVPFVPVQVWCAFKFKTFVFLALCRFDAPWSSKPNAFAHLCFDVVCRISSHIWHFVASHAVVWKVRCIFHAKGLQFEEQNDLFQKQILFSGYCSFFLLKCQYISSHMYSGCNSYWYVRCFWTCDHIDYLVV